MPIADGTIAPVAEVRLVVDHGEHPALAGRGAAIAAFWDEEQRRNPLLFNGRIYLQRGLALSGGTLSATSHPAPYAALLHWLRHGDRSEDLWHLFAAPLIVSSDGALLLGKMASWTANPGRIYAPSGSLDDSDIVAGHCDLARNMAREVAEETGLDLSEAAAEAGAHLYRSGRVATVFRRYRFDRPAAALAAAVRAHIAAQTEPELVEPVVLRAGAAVEAAMPAYMKALVAFHFGPGQDAWQAGRKL